jgi:hypothetical protein
MPVKVVDVMERITSEMGSKDELGIVSVVAYGTDIQKDLSKAYDYNMLFVVNDIDINVIKGIHDHICDQEVNGLERILIMERSEIEGMVDSVPETFLQLLISFQMLYGPQPFINLSSISHEHLRAQTERCVRESLCRSRICLVRGLCDHGGMVESIIQIREILDITIRLFHVLSRPWITEEKEHRDAFKEEFPGVSVWIDMLDRENFDKMDQQMLQSLAHNLINEGIKPMLLKVDEMGP